MKTVFCTGNKDMNQQIMGRFPEMERLAELNELADIPATVNLQTDLIIMSSFLDRTGELPDVLTRIRDRNSTCRVILIVPEADDEFRHGMASIGIYDLIEPDEEGLMDEALLFDVIEHPRTEEQLIRKFEPELPQAKKANVPRPAFKLPIPFGKKGGGRKLKVVGKQIIAFWSPMARGKTTLAAHCAAYLADTTKLKIVLADADPLKPDLERILKLDPEKGFSDALELIQEGRADYERLDKCLTPHPKYEGLDILFGHRTIADFYQATLPNYEELMEKLLIRRDIMILDLHGVRDFSVTEAALRVATKVYVPVRAEKFEIERVNGFMEEFRNHGDYDIRKFSLLINEYGPLDLTCTEVEASSTLNVAGYIREEKGMQRKYKLDRKLMDQMQHIDLLGSRR